MTIVSTSLIPPRSCQPKQIVKQPAECAAEALALRQSPVRIKCQQHTLNWRFCNVLCPKRQKHGSGKLWVVLTATSNDLHGDFVFPIPTIFNSTSLEF